MANPLELLLAGLTSRSYDVARGFSTRSDPNGVWRYGYTTSLGGTLDLYTATQQPYAGIVSWIDPTVGNEPNVEENVSRSVATDGDRLTWQPGELSLSPGPNAEYSDIRWTAPRAGFLTIHGAFSGDLNTGGYLSSDVHVLVNGASVFDGEIDSAQDVAAFNRAVAVKAGDRVDFAVGAGSDGSNVSDTTALSATLRLTPVAPHAYVATGGLWSASSDWLGGSVPPSGAGTQIVIAPGTDSHADLGTAAGPFVAGSIRFSPTTDPTHASSLSLDGGNIRVGTIIGDGQSLDQVTVGNRSPLATPGRPGDPGPAPSMVVTQAAYGIHFVVNGVSWAGSPPHSFIPPVSGRLELDGSFANCSFSLTGGLGSGPNILVLQHPVLGFIGNEIDVQAYHVQVPGVPIGNSPDAWIELGGIQFDRASFVPRVAGDASNPAAGTVQLFEQNRLVGLLTDVHASGYAPGAGGTFFVGTDTATGNNYVGYGYRVTS